MVTFKEAEHAGWTEKARAYDTNFSEIAAQAIDPILDRLGDIAGLAVLDICCGTGAFCAAAQQRGAKVTGLDFTSTMIEIATAKVPQATFVTGDAEDLGFEDDRFDAAVCSFGLWHLAEADRALAEAARVLKPGGRFVYTTWLPPVKGCDLLRIVMDAVSERGSMEVDLPPAPPPFRFADEGEAVKALAAHGFRDITYEERMAVWRGQTGRAVLDLIYESLVRTPMIIEAQSSDAREAIKKRIIEKSEAMGQGGAIRMNWPYCVVAASRS